MRRGKAEGGGFDICVMVRPATFLPRENEQFPFPDVWPTDREKGVAPFKLLIILVQRTSSKVGY